VGVRFSTEDVRDDVRFEYWLDRHRGALDTDLRLLSGRHPHFRASCEIHALGPAEVAVLSYAGSPVPTAGEARRTARDTGRPDGYEIKIPLAAEEFVVSQGDRQARLDPGDFAIVDTARPSSAIVGSRSAKRVVSLILPRVALPVPPARVADVVAVPFSGRHGTAALVSTLLRQITEDADAYDPADATRVSAALVDLIAASVAARLDLRPALPPDARRNALLRRIYAHIEQHLADPGLTPAAIAAAHHISLRQLHKLFEPEQLTVAAWIRGRRLERCRRDLADPALTDRPIGAIAARWGFTDTTGFHRQFRAAHGTPPGAYRRLMTGHTP